MKIERMTNDEVCLVLAKRCKTLRKAQGYSQKEFANRMGISYATFKKFEQTGQIGLATFVSIARGLGRIAEFESVLNMDLIEKEGIEKYFK